MLALSVAAALAIFLLYTSIAGGGNPSLQPSALHGRTGKVELAGRVVGPVRGDAHAGELRFALRDVGGSVATAVPVVYTGSVPDLFRAGRDVVVSGRLHGGTFVAEPGTMITKCPSKYSPKKSGGSA